MSSDVERTYSVPGVSCEHCVRAVTEEVGQVAGVESVVVDLDSKRVTVSGEAIDEAGYDVAS